MPTTHCHSRSSYPVELPVIREARLDIRNEGNNEHEIFLLVQELSYIAKHPRSSDGRGHPLYLIARHIKNLTAQDLTYWGDYRTSALSRRKERRPLL